MDKNSLIKSGKILEKALRFAKKILKKNVPIIEIANKVEEFIIKKNAKPAFPVNLSINEVAAHYSPFPDDKLRAFGLIKIDAGVNYNHHITDAAISINLSNDIENTKLIDASRQALKQSLKIIKPEIEVCEIGSIIEKQIKKFGFKPIYNLSGHNITFNSLHGGKTIPNYNNKEKTKLEYGEIVAIEPFTTNGVGYVEDGKPSSIWILKRERKPRLYREIYDFIKTHFGTFPFTERWIKISNYLYALKYFKQQGIIHNYPQLVEKTNAKVSQYETTILVEDKPKILVNVFEI